VKRAIALSVIDQGVLSAQSVLFGFLLMRMGDAESVGRFALSMSAFFIFLAIQLALVSTPLMVKVYGRPTAEQARILSVVCTFDVYILAAAVVSTVVLLGAIGFTALEIAAAVAMVASGLVRELSRSVSISTGDMRTCLRVDASSVVVSLLLLWPLATVLPPQVAFLFCIAVGNCAAILIVRPDLHIGLREVGDAFRAYRPYLSITRWSLTGGVSAEVQSRTFLFIVEILRGTAATGILQVGRFIVSPLSLISLAWGRVALPRMAAHFRNDAADRAFTLLYVSIACITAMAIAYFAVIYFAWDWLDHFIFQDKYPGLTDIVLAWCAYTLVSEPVRALGWAYQATDRFRELALLVMANAIGVLVLMATLVFPVPLYTTLVILTFGQLCLGAALVWLMPTRERLREVTV
jgi:O-antigen/teichoic acid export membrane protein